MTIFNYIFIFLSMRKLKNSYNFYTNYCLRSPAFSLDLYFNLLKNETIANEDLRELWSNSYLKESIFLASPELYNRLEVFFEGKITDSAKKERLKYAFLKYIARVSTRCTPFGLFAGVSVGDFRKETLIEINFHLKHKKQTRFDMDFLLSLLNYISNISNIKNQLLFFPNNTLYLVANHYRYLEYQLEGTKKIYTIEGVEASSYLKKIIKKAKAGMTMKHLVNNLIDNDTSTQEATDFVEKLIDNQILVSELEPSVIGENILDYTIGVLRKLNGTEKEIVFLELLQKGLNFLDKKTGNKTSLYGEIIKKIKQKDIPFDNKYLFQTDLFVNTISNQLNIKHAYTLKRSLLFLNKLTHYKEKVNLKNFKKAFIERYEAKEVQLIKVLDIESGIGYIQNKSISDTTPFLNDITPTEKQEISEKEVLLTKTDQILYKKLFKALQQKRYSVELKDDDFNDIQIKWDDLPDTMSAIIEVVILDGKEKVVTNGVSGSSAANILSRFCYSDKMLLKYVRNIISTEKQIHSNKILAEIVHLPEARVGNILKRPEIREYEIPYLAKSNLPLSKQISVDDLMISIKKNRIILRSKTLNKEVLPRLTNAHNYSKNSLPVYHFLCDLQTQNIRSGLGFSWKNIAENHSFLPRAIYKDIILSKATWYISKEEIKLFIEFFYKEKQLLKEIRSWRKDIKMPQYVQLVESDNTLLINLENVTSIQLLINTIKNKKKSKLEEFLFTENTVVNNKNGRFSNEFVVSFYNEEKLKTEKAI